MFISKNIERLFEERNSRYITAMNGGTPDRIPIRFFLQEAAARYMGYTTQNVACSYNSAFEVTRKTAEDLGIDAVMLNAIWSNYGVGKALGLKYFHVPGVDTYIDSVLQYSEPEHDEDLFMQQDEYDEFSSDPTAFIMTKWLSRVSSRVSPLGGEVNFDHNTALISGSMAYANYMNSFGAAANALKFQSGIVSANSGMVKAPFDILADKFRGFIPLIYDCYECPEKVLTACEALMPHMVANALAKADPDKNVPITFWAHRGCIPFINREMFDTIYWATLKPVIEEITSKGHQILFYGEGNWEEHYDDILGLRENTIIYHLDRGDIKKVARLKEKFSISGGLSYEVLSQGDTDDVKSHMKDLFATLAHGGGYILDATALMLHDVKPENLRTAVEYTLENGIYSQGSSFIREKQIFDVPEIKTQTSRPPLVCRPWELESKNYKNLVGDIELVKSSWQAVDTPAYDFAWTTVLW